MWGGATSANQYEGAWNAAGKGDSFPDHLTAGSRTQPRLFHNEIKPDVYYPCHDGVDGYHHYKEDVALFAEMGFKVYRLSINWPRLFPKGDEEKPNEEGVSYYRSVLEECHKYGIEPLVTISHLEMPYYLCKNYGGWADRKLISFYLNLCKVLFTEYKGLVRWWLTFNEINGLANGADFPGGLLPEEGKPLFDFSPKSNEYLSKRFSALHHQFLASALAVKLAHEIDPQNRVGCMILGRASYPLTCKPEDIMANYKDEQMGNRFCSDVQVRGYYPSYALKKFENEGIVIDWQKDDETILKEGKVDFYSFSYYSSGCVTADKDIAKAGGNIVESVKNPYLTASDWGWTIDPLGLRYYLNEIYDRYQVPIMIVENGLGAFDRLEEDGTIHDPYRIDYTRRHIEAMADAINIDGVDLIGYTYWGCIDVVSGGTGEMAKRYGFIYVDKNDDGSGSYKRYRKDSFYWYKKVIESNGENLD